MAEQSERLPDFVGFLEGRLFACYEELSDLHADKKVSGVDKALRVMLELVGACKDFRDRQAELREPSNVDGNPEGTVPAHSDPQWQSWDASKGRLIAQATRPKQRSSRTTRRRKA